MGTEEVIDLTTTPATFDTASTKHIPTTIPKHSTGHTDEKTLEDGEFPSGEEGPSSTLQDQVIELYPPDHPRGWFSLIATFCSNFIVFGYNYSWGLFQQQYLDDTYADQVTSFSLSFVGSLGMATLFLLGPFIGLMVKRTGIRIPITVGGILIFLGLFLASYANAPWQLYLTHGLLFGMGASLSFFSTIHLPTQWFEKRIGLATGIALAGSGIGGLVMDQIVHAMISSIGYRWALRVVSFISLAMIFTAAATAKERPLKLRWSDRIRNILDLSLLRNSRFSTLAIMGLITTFGYMAPFFFLPSYSTFIGLDASTGATLTSVMSAVNAIGRIVTGWAADRVGRLNTLFLCTFVAGLSCMVIWPFAKSLGVLIVFVLFYGFTGGGFISLFPVVAKLFIPVKDLSNAMGILFFSQAFGNLFGPAILGALLDQTAPNTSYVPGQMFCGAATIVGALIILGIKFSMEKKPFAKL
ncbi:major facilitator superfamily domain-containing protein [Piptocephalis cylindrospora]|uniref:Major facilitator superfamily domain-containing protein n=1 Tax=Piptocephalis cylindrospora TaxID=1907219 RepID=A0A4P9Y8D5_9FUNG|nr:major facilitator superfamily domain-containing protein [Piptocephalis cylindrospora]|eukprot:RKP14591.1 major facilitator superfamily domain-containing protein [Piptocephalis cylindrospora]